MQHGWTASTCAAHASLSFTIWVSCRFVQLPHPGTPRILAPLHPTVCTPIPPHTCSARVSAPTRNPAHAVVRSHEILCERIWDCVRSSWTTSMPTPRAPLQSCVFYPRYRVSRNCVSHNGRGPRTTALALAQHRRRPHKNAHSVREPRTERTNTLLQTPPCTIQNVCARSEASVHDYETLCTIQRRQSPITRL